MDDKTYIPGLGASLHLQRIEPGFPRTMSADDTQSDDNEPFELSVSAEEYDRIAGQTPNLITPLFIPVPKRTITAEDRRAKEKLVEKRRAKSKAASRARARNRR